MSILIELVGIMRKPKEQTRHEVPYTPGLTATELLEHIGFHSQEIVYLTILCQGTRVNKQAALQDEMRLKVYLPLGGG